ncbi:MAG: DUF1566 domain-containing protein, partial [Saprospiraceae bacterium]|nr:DUF1566 domain-containing protein [Saprospiraceae bacterium]
NATGDWIGAGAMNTMLIIALQTNDNPQGNFAAKLCADFSITDVNEEVYGDWYLPSKYELNLMFTNLHLAGLGGFDGQYWSSTESNISDAWYHNFHLPGVQAPVNKAPGFLAVRVRAVRAF